LTNLRLISLTSEGITTNVGGKIPDRNNLKLTEKMVEPHK